MQVDLYNGSKTVGHGPSKNAVKIHGKCRECSAGVYVVCSVSAGDEAVDISAGAHLEAWRQRGDRILVLSPATLETGRRRHQPATVHLGRK